MEASAVGLGVLLGVSLPVTAVVRPTRMPVSDEDAAAAVDMGDDWTPVLASTMLVGTAPVEAAVDAAADCAASLVVAALLSESEGVEEASVTSLLGEVVAALESELKAEVTGIGGGRMGSESTEDDEEVVSAVVEPVVVGIAPVEKAKKPSL